VIVDHDQVELSNLQRQIVHATPAIGEDKAASAARQLKALNPDIEITAINRKLDEAELLAQVGTAQVVVDASDNFATRFAINRACVAAKRPLVSGAVVRFEGQVAVFRPDLPDGPCYRCLYADTNAPEETCAEFGVLAPAAGVIGSIQATETIKVLLGIGQTLAGRLLVLDLLNMEWRTLRLRKDSACPVCGTL
jgi:adenylyltransferase/sulfurtransferase